MSEILAGVLVLITGFYAWATYRILLANEKVVNVMSEQSEALRRPYISVVPYTVPGTPLLGIRIANTGRSPAHNLRLSMDKDFYKFGVHKESSNIANYTAFCEPIDMFAPGAELIFDLAMGFDIFGKDANESLMPKSFTITAQYEFFEKSVNEKNTIDLTPFEGSTMPRDSFVKELEEIRKAIEKLKPK